VLSLNFVTNNSEQTVIEGVASDKVYCTHNNRQHIFKIFKACRLCLKILALHTPCFGVWYRQGVRVPPVKNHCLCLTNIKLNCIAYRLRFFQSVFDCHAFLHHNNALSKILECKVLYKLFFTCQKLFRLKLANTCLQTVTILVESS